MAGIEREPAEVRIPRIALDAFAVALSVRTVAMRTWPDGIGWMYPVGTWDEPHLEVALMPGGEEVWLRMSTDRSGVAVWTIGRWWAFCGELPGATPPPACDARPTPVGRAHGRRRRARVAGPTPERVT
ncbi:hypothetical protein [Streptomyces uncialis]|uniref:hypothetical protein n=1 Tax=Streptomyces uncialis TaxID=1048205 RepID=UPI0033C65CD0